MHYKQYKTTISPKGGMNIYRGCTHGCIYCDSRSACYNFDHDFEDIEVKLNADLILDSQLARKKKKSMLSTGSMCDPYLPIEEELRLTRRCLEVVYKHGFGISVLTKSSLILRDVDLLTAIHKKARCVVEMTLTTYDEDLCKVIEPDVASTKERVEVLKAMHNAGLPTVVWLCPILPFINDTEENLLGILRYCADAKVSAILNFGFGMTLREGSRDYFYTQLDKFSPGMKERYKQAFGNSYECTSPASKRLSDIFIEFCKANSIIYGTNDVFSFVSRFEPADSQMSFLPDS
ncbi:MAG: radical SAM protein [Eubacteriaceae bacterium]|nr:radical SAM protein [Eubacteriaceae bacterium]